MSKPNTTKLPANQHEVDDLRALLRADKDGVRVRFTSYNASEGTPGYTVITAVDLDERAFLDTVVGMLWAKEVSFYNRGFAMREVLLDLIDGGWVDQDLSEAEVMNLGSILGAAMCRTEESPVYGPRKFSWEE